MSSLRPLTLAALIASLPAHVPAQQNGGAELPPRYNVEVIVFAHADVDPGEELFELDQPIPALDERPAAATSPQDVVAIAPIGNGLPRPGMLDDGESAPDDPTRLPPGPSDPAGVGGDGTAADASASDALEYIDPFGRLRPADALPGVPGTAPAGPGSPAVPGTEAPGTTAPGTAVPGAGAPGTTPAAARPAPPPFRLLRPAELELGDARRILDRLGAYRLLGHGGWQQYGLDQGEAMPVDLARLGITNPTGTIELYLGRFLHVRFDLDYRSGEFGTVMPAAVEGQTATGVPTQDPTQAPIPGPSGAGPSRPGPSSPLAAFALPARYHLETERNAIRSGELHYVDHPRFGVLLRVTPAPEEPAETTEPGSEERPSA